MKKRPPLAWTESISSRNWSSGVVCVSNSAIETLDFGNCFFHSFEMHSASGAEELPVREAVADDLLSSEKEQVGVVRTHALDVEGRNKFPGKAEIRGFALLEREEGDPPPRSAVHAHAVKEGLSRRRRRTVSPQHAAAVTDGLDAGGIRMFVDKYHRALSSRQHLLPEGHGVRAGAVDHDQPSAAKQKQAEPAHGPLTHGLDGRAGSGIQCADMEEPEQKARPQRF